MHNKGGGGTGQRPVERRSLAECAIWEKMRSKRMPFRFDLELTARCNNNCRHCAINLPVSDRAARGRELTRPEIERFAREAVGLGALRCLMTGGEPLVREDFFDMYLALKRAGLRVSVFTNATLVTEEHAMFFKKYPPKNVEVSVYGVTEKTYEGVTRTPGSFERFMRGLALLSENGVKVRLKAMALRSNLHELPRIARFCRERTRDYFRFDPFLNLRYDRDPARNREIRAERLAPDEIVALERSDRERFTALRKNADTLVGTDTASEGGDHLFHCGLGATGFTLGADGRFRVCSSLVQPDCVYDLRRGSLTDAWRAFTPRVLKMRSNRKEFLETCRGCGLKNLCMWCPAHAHLETGELDSPVEYFCAVAHARARLLTGKKTVRAGGIRRRLPEGE